MLQVIRMATIDSDIENLELEQLNDDPSIHSDFLGTRLSDFGDRSVSVGHFHSARW